MDPEGNHFRVGAVRTSLDSVDNHLIVAPSTTALDGHAIQGLYGELFIGADGSYRYLIDNENPLVNSLAAGERVSRCLYCFLVDSTPIW